MVVISAIGRTLAQGIAAVWSAYMGAGRKTKWAIAIVALIFLVGIAGSFGGNNDDAPEPVAAVVDTPTAAATATAIPTEAPTEPPPTATEEPTPGSPSPTATATAEPTSTPTVAAASSVTTTPAAVACPTSAEEAWIEEIELTLFALGTIMAGDFVDLLNEVADDPVVIYTEAWKISTATTFVEMEQLTARLDSVEAPTERTYNIELAARAIASYTNAGLNLFVTGIDDGDDSAFSRGADALAGAREWTDIFNEQVDTFCEGS